MCDSVVDRCHQLVIGIYTYLTTVGLYNLNFQTKKKDNLFVHNFIAAAVLENRTISAPIRQESDSVSGPLGRL